MRRRESLQVLSGGVASVALGAACASGPGSRHSLVGQKAPVSASLRFSSAARVTLVDFWASWCEPCRDAFAAYERLLRLHPGELQVIGVSLDESQEDMHAYGRSARVTFPLVWDGDQGLARAYRVPSLPTAFVLDRAGTVRHVFVGFVPEDERYLEAAVAELLV